MIAIDEMKKYFEGQEVTSVLSGKGIVTKVFANSLYVKFDNGITRNYFWKDAKSMLRINK